MQTFRIFLTIMAYNGFLRRSNFLDRSSYYVAMALSAMDGAVSAERTS